MIDLTPERRAELRELAERAHPFVRHGGTDPAAVYVPAADLLTLLNAADERDRLAAVVERVRGVGRVTGPRLALIAMAGLALWAILIGTIGLVVHAIAGLIS